MRDEDHAGVERRELPLEPLEALDVEVVGRLVEQQEVGVARERAGERGARELAARERLQRPVEVGVGEPEPAHDGARAVAPVVAAGVLEAGLYPRVAAEHRGVVVAGRHRLLEAAQLLLERDEVGGAREDVLAQGQLAVERRALVVERDPRALLEHDLARLQGGLARDRPQQRRLARAVRPGERDAVAPLDLERDVLEQHVRAELLAEAGCDQDGHAHRVVAREYR